MRHFLSFPSVSLCSLLICFHCCIPSFFLFPLSFLAVDCYWYIFCPSDTISRTKRLIRGVAHSHTQIPWYQTLDNLSVVWAHRLSAGTPPRKRRTPGVIPGCWQGHTVVDVRGGSLKANLVSSLWPFFLQATLAASIISLSNMSNFFYSLVVMVSFSPKKIL